MTNGVGPDQLAPEEQFDALFAQNHLSKYLEQIRYGIILRIPSYFGRRLEVGALCTLTKSLVKELTTYFCYRSS